MAGEHLARKSFAVGMESLSGTDGAAAGCAIDIIDNEKPQLASRCTRANVAPSLEPLSGSAAADHTPGAGTDASVVPTSSVAGSECNSAARDARAATLRSEELAVPEHARVAPLVAAAMTRHAQFQSSLGTCLAFIGTICAAALAGLIALANHDPYCHSSAYVSAKQRSLAVCSGVVLVLLVVAGPWLVSLRQAALHNNTALNYYVTQLVKVKSNEFGNGNAKQLVGFERSCNLTLLTQVNFAMIGWAIVVWVFGVGIAAFACDAVCWGSGVPGAKTRYHVIALIVSVGILSIGILLSLTWFLRSRRTLFRM